MSDLQFFWHSYRYLPYERRLALKEIAALTGMTPQETADGVSISVRSGQSFDKAIKRLTYFKGAQNGSGKPCVPDQAKLEASANGNGSTWRPEVNPIPTLRRQSTRYSAHGLHEYRGKFNPQMVRAIGNLIGLGEGDWLLDPFCGSGTSLLEAAHIGWNAVGTDINPLGVLIANAKVSAFKSDPVQLEGSAEALIKQLSRNVPHRFSSAWREVLPNGDYLEEWFPAPVLAQLAFIAHSISGVSDIELRTVFRVVMSDICRNVSLQDPGDLRIRRRKDPAESYPAVSMFIDSLRAKVASVLRAKKHTSVKPSLQRAILDDSRTQLKGLRPILSGSGRRTFDAALCSPPYATALPYIDTQRLSLCLLGMIRSDEIRTVERSLIGNREIANRERLDLEAAIRSRDAKLPSDVSEFCEFLLHEADHDSHGFRKRNVPCLVYKYFVEMSSMFASVHQLLRKGGAFALVVGPNRTTLRGKEVGIDTPSLLASVASSRNWHVEDMTKLDTYQRYDLHQENSIRGETLMILRRD